PATMPSRTFHTGTHLDTISTSTDQIISWLDSDRMDIWQQSTMPMQSEMSSAATHKVGKKPGLKQTWLLIDNLHLPPGITDFGSDICPSSTCSNSSMSKSNEATTTYGISLGGNMMNYFSNVMLNYASTCGAMSGPTNGSVGAETEWKDSCNAYVSSTDGKT
ncbi:7395_t:CDS:1, partial [Paraglomus occultum]